MSDLTERIDSLMVRNGITRYKFCKDSGINEGAYRAWINGSKPSAEACLTVAKYFNVSLQYIVTGEEDYKPSEEFHLSEEENQLIEAFRQLPRRRKNSLLELIEGFVALTKSEEVTGE